MLRAVTKPFVWLVRRQSRLLLRGRRTCEKLNSAPRRKVRVREAEKAAANLLAFDSERASERASLLRVRLSCLQRRNKQPIEMNRFRTFEPNPTLFLSAKAMDVRTQMDRALSGRPHCNGRRRRLMQCARNMRAMQKRSVRAHVSRPDLPGERSAQSAGRAMSGRHRRASERATCCDMREPLGSMQNDREKAR